jgi:chromosome segregation ATPase
MRSSGEDWLEPPRQSIERIRKKNAAIREETERIREDTEKLRQQNASLKSLTELQEKLKRIVEASIIKSTLMDDEQLLEQVSYGLDLIKNQMRQNKETLVTNEKYLREIQESSHLVAKEDLFDTQAASSYLGITNPDTIRNWLEGGSFPGAFQSRGQWFFPVVELNKVKHRIDEIQTKNKNRDLQPPDPSDDYDLWAVYD